MKLVRTTFEVTSLISPFDSYVSDVTKKMYSTPGPSLPSSPHIAHIVGVDHLPHPVNLPLSSKRAFLEQTTSSKYSTPSIPNGSSDQLLDSQTES
jgi:hypothetical protein